MPDLPVRPDLDQLRHQAKDLLHAAQRGDPDAAARIRAISDRVAAGTPVNQADAEWGRLPLHVAAGNGRAASVRRLLAHGADPNLRDPRHHCTPLEECQPPNGPLDSPGHAEVEAILRPLTRQQDAGA